MSKDFSKNNQSTIEAAVAFLKTMPRNYEQFPELSHIRFARASSRDFFQVTEQPDGKYLISIQPEYGIQSFSAIVDETQIQTLARLGKPILDAQAKDSTPTSLPQETGFLVRTPVQEALSFLEAKKDYEKIKPLRGLQLRQEENDFTLTQEYDGTYRLTISRSHFDPNNPPIPKVISLDEEDILAMSRIHREQKMNPDPFTESQVNVDERSQLVQPTGPFVASGNPETLLQEVKSYIAANNPASKNEALNTIMQDLTELEKAPLPLLNKNIEIEAYLIGQQNLAELPTSSNALIQARSILLSAQAGVTQFFSNALAPKASSSKELPSGQIVKTPTVQTEKSIFDLNQKEIHTQYSKLSRTGSGPLNWARDLAKDVGGKISNKGKVREEQINRIFKGLDAINHKISDPELKAMHTYVFLSNIQAEIDKEKTFNIKGNVFESGLKQLCVQYKSKLDPQGKYNLKRLNNKQGEAFKEINSSLESILKEKAATHLKPPKQ